MKYQIWNIDAAQVPHDIYEFVADNISIHWKKLGGRLGISRPVLNDIAAENDLVREKSAAMLYAWDDKTGKNATVGVLRKALEEIGKKGLSEKVIGMNISGSVYLLHST